MMAEEFNDALGRLRKAIADGSDTVTVTFEMSKRAAERLVQLIEVDGNAGTVVLPVKEFYTTTEASTMLGISRATLMKLIDAGEVEAIKVGTHHRVPASELVAYQRDRQTSRERANEMLTEFASRSAAGFQSNVTFRTGHRDGE